MTHNPSTLSSSQEQENAVKILRQFSRWIGIAGVLFLGFGIYFLFVANQTLTWPSTKGTIVKAEVLTHVSQAGRQSRPVRDALKEYYVALQYEYRLADIPYYSSQYSFGDGNRASEYYLERADAVAAANARFPAGTAIDVYYDPANPVSSVLEAGINWGTTVPLILGIFFLGTAWLMKVLVKHPGKEIIQAH